MHETRNQLPRKNRGDLAYFRACQIVLRIILSWCLCVPGLILFPRLSSVDFIYSFETPLRQLPRPPQSTVLVSPSSRASTANFTMQRPTYGQSPPLHHPVPQHVSTVPQLRSPPPPASQSSYGGSSPYPQQQQQQQQGAGMGMGNMFGQYGNFINDPAAQLASQLGQSAFKQGQDYLQNNVGVPRSLPSL